MDPPPEENGFIAIAAGSDCSLAIRLDGSIVAWGIKNTTWYKPPEDKGFVEASVGYRHAIALKENGDVIVWGGTSAVPVKDKYNAVSAGDSFNVSIVNSKPVAVTGPNKICYAGVNGIAEVQLNGVDSYDPDGDELTYYWNWAIDGNIYEANGINPTIELPIGVHTIQLVVNDGLVDSVPDDVNITVIAPLKGKLQIMPCIINRDICDRHSRYHKPEKILAIVRLPEGITKKDIDNNEPLTLYPSGIEALRQWVIPFGDGKHKQKLVGILAFFDKDDVLDAIPDNGLVELEVAGNLTSGQYFYGSDTVKIIGPRRPFHWPKK